MLTAPFTLQREMKARARALGRAVALLVLVARGSPTRSRRPARRRSSSAAGGPGCIVVVHAGLGSASRVGSTAVLWLAALGVRERARCSSRARVAPRLAPAHASPCTAARALRGQLRSPSRLLESYLHWRAGLGFHGLLCLLGPVHRDALPILAPSR